MSKEWRCPEHCDGFGCGEFCKSRREVDEVDVVDDDEPAALYGSRKQEYLDALDAQRPSSDMVSAGRARDLLAGWEHGSLSRDPPEEDGGGCPVYSETSGAALAMVDAPEVARMFAAAPDLARTVIAQAEELAENATEIERLRLLLDAEEMRQYASDPKVHAQLAAENERLDEMRRLVFARNAELTTELARVTAERDSALLAPHVSDGTLCLAGDGRPARADTDLCSDCALGMARLEVERLRAEVSTALDLPPTVGPAPGELARIVRQTREALATALSGVCPAGYVMLPLALADRAASDAAEARRLREELARVTDDLAQTKHALDGEREDAAEGNAQQTAELARLNGEVTRLLRIADLAVHIHLDRDEAIAAAVLAEREACRAAVRDAAAVDDHGRPWCNCLDALNARGPR